MLAETSTDLICVLEPDGAVRYASPACRDLLGLEPEQLLGRAFTDLVHEDDAAGVAVLLGGREGAPVSSPTACAAHTARCGWRRACASCAIPRPAPSSRATRPSATSPSACSPRPRWPRPRSASAPPSRRRRSAWRITVARRPLPARQPRARLDHSAYTPATSSRACRVASSSRTPTTSRPTGEARGGDARRRARRPSAPRSATCTRAGSAVWVALSTSTRRARRPTASRCTSSRRCRTSPSAAATRPSCATSPTTTRSPACSTAARSSASSSATSPTSARYGAARRGDRARPRPLQDDQRHARPRRRRRARSAASPTRCASRLRESDVLARLGGDEFAVLLPERGAATRPTEVAAATCSTSVRARRPCRPRTGRARTSRRASASRCSTPRARRDRRGRARRRRPRDVRRQGGRARPLRGRRRRRRAPRRGSRRASRGPT